MGFGEAVTGKAPHDVAAGRWRARQNALAPPWSGAKLFRQKVARFYTKPSKSPPADGSRPIGTPPDSGYSGAFRGYAGGRRPHRAPQARAGPRNGVLDARVRPPRATAADEQLHAAPQGGRMSNARPAPHSGRRRFGARRCAPSCGFRARPRNVLVPCRRMRRTAALRSACRSIASPGGALQRFHGTQFVARLALSSADTTDSSPGA